MRPFIRQFAGRSAKWIRRDFLDDAIAPLAVRIRQSIKRCAFFWILDRVLEIAPLLVEESFAIGDEKLEVARIGLIDMRIIDFVDDAVRNREPDPTTGVIGGPNPFLGALRPARFGTGSAKGFTHVGMQYAFIVQRT
jgi:hypothetical protein